MSIVWFLILTPYNLHVVLNLKLYLITQKFRNYSEIYTLHHLRVEITIIFCWILFFSLQTSAFEIKCRFKKQIQFRNQHKKVFKFTGQNLIETKSRSCPYSNLQKY